MKNKPVVLCILDGWGLAQNEKYSAIAKSKIDFYNSLPKNYPNCQLEASELFVGLPEGQMGNSEVGHTNIGAGRVVLQDLPRINKTTKEKSFLQNKVFAESIADVKKSKGKMHLLGLLSDGGVHSHIEHIIEMAITIAKENVDVLVHCFLDGRDTPQKSALTYINKFIDETKSFKNIKIATIGGRYFGMDRDNKWDRVEKAYNIFMSSENSNKDPIVEIEKAYSNNITDEFIEPIAVNNFDGMKDGDGFIFANYRADRARQISLALGKQSFTSFNRKKVINFSSKIQMTEYSSEHNEFMETLFGSEEINDCLGEIIAKNNLNQLRIAETEKYAHVTFFFNAGREEPFKNEERILIKSPAVATYDLQPEMSANELTDNLLKAIETNKFDLIVVNYANPDMVGHTGNMEATIKACETVNNNLEKVVKLILQKDGIICVTADHGNAEKMFDEEKNQPYTAHTINRVPFILVGNNTKNIKLKNGSLSNIAPTILELMSIRKPELMTGTSLIEK